MSVGGKERPKGRVSMEELALHSKHGVSETNFELEASRGLLGRGEVVYVIFSDNFIV